MRLSNEKGRSCTSAGDYLPWLRKAGNDILNIENNLRSDRAPWDTVCFHAQQATEKYLRAFLVFHASVPPRTHDLVALLAACVHFAPSLAILEADCRALSSYAVAARYPSDLDAYEPDENDGTAVVAATRRVSHAIHALLPDRSPADT